MSHLHVLSVRTAGAAENAPAASSVFARPCRRPLNIDATGAANDDAVYCMRAVGSE